MLRFELNGEKRAADVITFSERLNYQNELEAVCEYGNLQILRIKGTEFFIAYDIFED